MNEFRQIKLDCVSIDGGTQSRVSINPGTVAEYAEAMTHDRAIFPPVTLFFDGADYWLADGFHRYHAHRKIGALDIDAEVREGTSRDAIVHSVGANGMHGLRRTNEDKRHAVMMLLNDPEWGMWSANLIAKQCGVSHTFVNDIKSSLEAASSEQHQESTYTTKHGTKTTMKIANIGKSGNQAKSRGAATRAIRMSPMAQIGLGSERQVFNSPEDDIAVCIKGDALRKPTKPLCNRGGALERALAEKKLLQKKLRQEQELHMLLKAEVRALRAENKNLRTDQKRGLPSKTTSSDANSNASKPITFPTGNFKPQDCLEAEQPC